MVLSHVKLEGKKPLADITLGDVLTKLSSNPTEYVILEDGSRFNSQDVLNKARSYAKGMLALGLTRQDRVMSVGIISVEAVALFAASLSVGVAYSHPTVYKPRDATLKDIISRLKPKLLFAGEGMKGDGVDSLQSLLTENKSIFPFVKEIFYDGSINGRPEGKALGKLLPELATIGEVVADETLADANKSVLTSDGALIVTSTGSTGSPKILSIPHFAVANMCDQQAENTAVLQLTTSTSGPSTADMTFYLTIANGLTNGYKKVVVAKDLDEEHLSDQLIDLAKAINDEEVHMNVVQRGSAAGLLQLVKHRGYTFPSLKVLLLGGQVMPPSFLKELCTTLKVLPVNGYGMSEVGSSIAMSPFVISPDDDLLQVFSQLKIREHVELMIVDDDGQPVERGTEGEIWIKSGYGIADFISPPIKSVDILSDGGFFKTGDIGVMNDNDSFEVRGRKSDSLRFKTHQRVVWPGKIESALISHASINKASVISAGENEFYGEEITCCICVEEGCEKPSEDDIINYIVEHADNLSRPCRIIFMENIPFTPNERKVDRKRLKREVAEMVKKDANYGITKWYKELLHQYKGE